MLSIQMSKRFSCPIRLPKKDVKALMHSEGQIASLSGRTIARRRTERWPEASSWLRTRVKRKSKSYYTFTITKMNI